jgi:hypothetical protein
MGDDAKVEPVAASTSPPDGAKSPVRRAHSTLDHSSEPAGDGTSRARFLIVGAILVVLALVSTNVLRVWSTPWQTSARVEAERKLTERREAERKAAERQEAAHRETARKAQEREAAARQDAARRAAEEATKRRAAEEVAASRRAAEEAAGRRAAEESAARRAAAEEAARRRASERAVGESEAAQRKSEAEAKSREAIEEARRKFEELTRKPIGSAPSTPASPPPVASGPKEPEARLPTALELLDKLLKDKGGRPAAPAPTVAQPPPPAELENRDSRIATSRPGSGRPATPNLATTSCRTDRSHVIVITACSEIIEQHSDFAEAYFVRDGRTISAATLSAPSPISIAPSNSILAMDAASRSGPTPITASVPTIARSRITRAPSRSCPTMRRSTTIAVSPA